MMMIGYNGNGSFSTRTSNMTKRSPRKLCPGWLGVKNQVTSFLTYLRKTYTGGRLIRWSTVCSPWNQLHTYYTPEEMHVRPKRAKGVQEVPVLQRTSETS